MRNRQWEKSPLQAWGLKYEGLEEHEEDVECERRRRSGISWRRLRRRALRRDYIRLENPYFAIAICTEEREPEAPPEPQRSAEILEPALHQ